jgi:hypothetical protein
VISDEALKEAMRETKYYIPAEKEIHTYALKLLLNVITNCPVKGIRDSKNRRTNWSSLFTILECNCSLLN